MAGVEVDPVELVGVGADRGHEAHRPVDLVGDLLVALADRRADDEVGVPGVDLAQVGVAAGDERAHEVQRRGAGVVGLDQPLRVGDAGLGGEVEAVDGVAAVRRQGHALAGLEVGGARLGVLAGQPAELHHRHRRGVGQHDRHLEQHAELVADVVGRGAGERLRAVAALEQERLAVRDVAELGLEVVALAGEDQRRHACAGARRRRRRRPASGYDGCCDGPSACSDARSGMVTDRGHPARVRLARPATSSGRGGDAVRLERLAGT